MYKAIYARKSKFNKDSISVESQIEFCKHELKKGENSKEYSDNGVSGKDTNRVQFQEMCKDIEKGIINKVIVYKLDRISRSIIDFANMMEFFAKYNVEFVSCSEKFDTSTPMGRAMLNICIVFAQLERETIQQRVTDAYHSRNKKGFYMGGERPFGFKFEKIQIDGINTSKYVPDEYEAGIVKTIYSMYAHQNATLSDIVKYLNQSNVISRRGTSWSHSIVGRLIKNPIYVRSDVEVYNFYKNQGTDIINNVEDFKCGNGLYLFNKPGNGTEKPKKGTTDLKQKELILAPHEGIISSDLWLKCVTKKLQNKSFSTNHRGKNSWLVGKVKCAKCGYSMSISVDRIFRKKLNKVLYEGTFRCSGRYVRKLCDSFFTVKVKCLEEQIFQAMKSKLTEFKELREKEKTLCNPKLSQYKTVIAKIDKQIEELLEKVGGANKILMDYINKKIEELDNERIAIQEKILELSTEATQSDINKITNYIDRWEEINFDEKIFVTDAIIKKISVADDTLKIEWKI